MSHSSRCPSILSRVWSEPNSVRSKNACFNYAVSRNASPVHFCGIICDQLVTLWLNACVYYCEWCHRQRGASRMCRRETRQRIQIPRIQCDKTICFANCVHEHNTTIPLSRCDLATKISTVSKRYQRIKWSQRRAPEVYSMRLIKGSSSSWYGLSSRPHSSGYYSNCDVFRRRNSHRTGGCNQVPVK